MDTIAAYYETPYRKTIDATVLSVDERGVVLDRTICYPEGGGQPGDRGTLGGRPLVDTVKDKEGRIFHKVEEPTCTVGDTVSVVLDWEHRYRYMRMHTAQHVASGILHSRFGIGTVSVHQGENDLTIEIDVPTLEQHLCHALEDAVNEAVLENHPVRYELYARDEAERLGMRRSIKVDKDDIRVVVVDGIDAIACGGLHTASTGEIGLVQYVGQEKIRGHVRLVFRVGEDALAEIRENRELVNRIGTLFSAPPAELYRHCERAVSLVARDKGLLELKAQRIADLVLASLVEKAERKDGVPVVLWTVTDDLEPKQVAKAFSAYDHLALCAVRQDGDRVRWLVGLSGSASTFLDFGKQRQQLLSCIDGKGGGRAPLWQGVGTGSAGTLLEKFRELLS
jgi:alanyl-tRNA synthetase